MRNDKIKITKTIPDQLYNAVKYLLVISLIAGICHLTDAASSAYAAPENGVIVVDAGHGGIDGGTNRDGLLEKDLCLKLALKLKSLLEQKGCNVILTRDRDVSLDNLNQASKSRHRRDLIARAGIINESKARIFLSLHVNSIADDPAENGSIVFYNNKVPESKTLALFLQYELNKITFEGENRKSHMPAPGRYFILAHTDIPGVIIETAFITNEKDREMLMREDFQVRLAAAIAAGTQLYLQEEQGAKNRPRPFFWRDVLKHLYKRYSYT